MASGIPVEWQGTGSDSWAGKASQSNTEDPLFLAGEHPGKCQKKVCEDSSIRGPAGLPLGHPQAESLNPGPGSLLPGFASALHVSIISTHPDDLLVYLSFLQLDRGFVAQGPGLFCSLTLGSSSVAGTRQGLNKCREKE